MPVPGPALRGPGHVLRGGELRAAAAGCKPDMLPCLAAAAAFLGSSGYLAGY